MPVANEPTADEFESLTDHAIRMHEEQQLQEQAQQGTAGVEPPMTRSMMPSASSVSQFAAPTVGSLAGGGIGGAIGGAPGYFAGSAIGAGAGQLAADIADERLFGGQRRTFVEKARRAGEQMATTLGAELALGKVGKVIRGKLQPAAISPEAELADQELRQYGGRLTPGQLSEIAAPKTKTLVNALEAVAGNSIGASRLSQAYQANKEALRKQLDVMLNRVKTDFNDEQLGLLLRGEIEKGNQVLSTFGKMKHADLVAQTKQAPIIDTRNFVRTIENATDPGYRSIYNKLFGQTTHNTREFMYSILTTPTQNARALKIDLGRAFDLRTQLRQIRDIYKGGTDKASKDAYAAADNLYTELNKSIYQGLHNLNPSLSTELALADDLGRQGARIWDSDIMKSLMETAKQRPGLMSWAILEGKPADVSARIQNLQQAVGKPYYDREIAPRLFGAIMHESKDIGGLIEDAMPRLASQATFNRATPQGIEVGRQLDNVIDGEKLLGTLKKYDKSAIDAIGGSGFYNKLLGLATTLKNVGTFPSGAGLKVAVQLGQASAMYGVMSGMLGGANSTQKLTQSLAIMLGPMALDRMLANPKLIDDLREGIALTYRTGKDIPLLTQTLRKLGIQQVGTPLVDQIAGPQVDELIKEHVAPNPTPARTRPSSMTLEPER